MTKARPPPRRTRSRPRGRNSLRGDDEDLITK